MKPLATFGILLLLGATSGARAAENWYLRNSTDPRSGDLQGKGGISAPLQYCFRGIAVGGGVCARQDYLEDMADRERKRTSGRPATKGASKNK